MPNFPASVYNAALKSAGQTIAAAFFNDPDAELNAIEDGYLNGTARLNSSASTVNTLSVSSNSTFAVRPTMPPPSNFALVFLQSSVTIGSSLLSTISWTGQEFVANSSMHSTATTPERLIPQSTGLYQITAQLAVSSNSTGSRQLVLRDSSANIVGAQTFAVTPNSDVTLTRLQATGFKRFDVTGGYALVDLSVAGAAGLSLSSGVGASWFAMLK